MLKNTVLERSFRWSTWLCNNRDDVTQDNREDKSSERCHRSTVNTVSTWLQQLDVSIKQLSAVRGAEVRTLQERLWRESHNGHAAVRGADMEGCILTLKESTAVYKAHTHTHTHFQPLKRLYTACQHSSHSRTHTFIHRWQRLSYKVPPALQDQPSVAIWGSVPYPRTLQHAELGIETPIFRLVEDPLYLLSHTQMHAKVAIKHTNCSLSFLFLLRTSREDNY